ncbi:MAG: transcription elongation factor GreA [Acidimicrobiales bacterium]
MADVHSLSPEAHSRLKAELEKLTGEGRIEIARKIETARELGDLSENGDYHAAKDEQGKMEARIRQLEALLQDAEIVEAAASDGTVRIGSTVTVRFDDGDTDTYLVGSIEERRDGLEVVSPGSPLGAALLGQGAGTSVTYDANGTDITVEIVSVEG